ncbi:hypothetical protein [Pseudorhizobium flavum]|uniref:hypothetical protein n=1 Tax=Pseudorhizobium flavum TaxID=1335061 RepID=UPI0024902754|nr:hypothetical protein [Pseudorhizobium flavum]
MGIVRQLVQISMVEAVRGKTIAQDDVFDSRIDSLPNLLKNSRRPLLIFSVEESQQDEEGSLDNGFLGRAGKLQVLVQAAVASVQEVKDGNDVVILPSIGESDAGFEATLNMLDRQWKTVLSGYADPWVNVFRGLVTSVGKITDARAADPETGRKHASRYTQVSLNVIDEPLPGDPVPPAVEAGLSLLEADGDSGYAEIADVYRKMLTEGEEWPEWRKIQAALFTSRGAMAGLGLGPLAIDDLVDFDEARLSVSVVSDVVMTDDP